MFPPGKPFDLQFPKIKVFAVLKFMVAIWPQASKQTSKHTHACVQCSNASVGLTQARPN